MLLDDTAKENEVADSSLMDDLAGEAAEAAAAGPGEDALESAKRLGSEVNDIDAKLAELAEEQNKLSARRNEILGRVLVDLMDSKQIEDFTVDGRNFAVANYYKASIPKEHADEAYTWLEENDAGDLIKYEVKVSFPRDCEEEAKRLVTYITQNFQMADVENKRSVPWATLTSWLKELWERDDPEKKLPPLDIIGGIVGRIVKTKEKGRR